MKRKWYNDGNSTLKEPIMSKESVNFGAQFRGDSPEVPEHEAVRTTIVGGRPPGSGKPLGPLPRGIEVLLKKAAVDPAFRKSLLENPLDAACSIGLELDPIEQAMLQTISKQQLSAVIAQTTVPEPQRRAFLGHAAVVMLAALGGLALTGCGDAPTKGSRPDDSPAPTGIRPDEPQLNGGSRPDFDDEEQDGTLPGSSATSDEKEELETDQQGNS